MRLLLRYARLLRTELGVSTTMAMQYRLDFFVHGVMAVFWMAITLMPLVAVFSQRTSVAGWTWPEALVVLGWFSLLKAIVEGGIAPSLGQVVAGVQDGTLDFVLLKPADAQFLVSTAQFDPWRLIDALGALVMLGYAFSVLGRWPQPADLALAGALLLLSLALLYSIWIVVVSVAFWAVKVDGLSSLFLSIFDAGRWPIDVFRGALRVVFTAVFPLALMTTYPAQALLGRLTLGRATLAFVGGAVFTGAARLVWQRALRHYTSAA